MTKDNDGLPQLPKGWTLARVGEVINNIPLTGRKLKQSHYKEKGKLPVIDQGQKFIGGHTDEEELRTNVNGPVIIFGDHTKVVKFVDFDFVAGADGVKALEPINPLHPKLFYYFLQAIELPEKGYARHFQFLEKSLIRIPPLPEQPRIVAKIEELFTNLDAGVESLKKVKTQSKRYRQAVLKYAFEGKLTEEWRKTHKDQIEPAHQLLERIKQERKKNVKEKYVDLPPVETTDLPELPEGWAWTRLGDIAEKIVDGSHNPPPKQESGIPMLSAQNVLNNEITFSDCRYVSVEEYEKEIMRVSIEANDVLLTIVGTIGRSAVVKETTPKFTVQRSVAVIRTNMKPEYLSFIVQSPFYASYFLKNARGTAQKGIYLNQLREVPLIVPPIPEQNRIVQEIEHYLSIADETERNVERSLKQTGRLRHSILKRAFEGRLVPQDPTDEPAEKLLERIKQEKAKRKTEIKAKKKNDQKQVELMHYVK